MRPRLLALAVALVAATPAAAAPAPRALTLRLTDLAAGYSLPFGPCEPSPSLADLSPIPDHNCVIEFGRAWTPPGTTPRPATVISVAAVFRSATGPQAALDHPREVASLAFDPAPDDFEVVAPAPAIGDEAVLLRVADGSAAVVWRSGSTLAAVLAGNVLRRHAPEVDVQAVLGLAAAQQARIAAPTPLRFADNDTSQVALDDPSLDLPVWWLGAKLPRQGGLPSLRLLHSEPAERHAARIGLGPVMLYGRPHAKADIIIELAHRSVLRRPAIRRELRRLKSDPCSHIDRLALADGRARIFVRDPRCDTLRVEDTPDALTDAAALAVLHGVVVFLVADDCTNCHGPVSRYESPGGMRRLVRALRRRL